MDPQNINVSIPEGVLKMMIAQKLLELQALTNALESCDESTTEETCMAASSSGYNAPPAAESTSSPAAPADPDLITKAEVLQQLGWFCDQVNGKKHAGPTEAEATASENTKIDTYLKNQGVTKLLCNGQDRYMWYKDSPEYHSAASVLKAYIEEYEDEIR